MKTVYISAFNGVILVKTRLTPPRTTIPLLSNLVREVRLESADVRIRNRYCFMLVRPSIPRLKTTENTRGQKSSKRSKSRKKLLKIKSVHSFFLLARP